MNVKLEKEFSAGNSNSPEELLGGFDSAVRGIAEDAERMGITLNWASVSFEEDRWEQRRLMDAEPTMLSVSIRVSVEGKSK